MRSHTEVCRTESNLYQRSVTRRGCILLLLPAAVRQHEMDNCVTSTPQDSRLREEEEKEKNKKKRGGGGGGRGGGLLRHVFSLPACSAHFVTTALNTEY